MPRRFEDQPTNQNQHFLVFTGSLHLLTMMLIFETSRHLTNLSICIDSCPLTVTWEALVGLKFHEISIMRVQNKILLGKKNSNKRKPSRGRLKDPTNSRSAWSEERWKLLQCHCIALNIAGYADNRDGPNTKLLKHWSTDNAERWLTREVCVWFTMKGIDIIFSIIALWKLPKEKTERRAHSSLPFDHSAAEIACRRLSLVVLKLDGVENKRNVIKTESGNSLVKRTRERKGSSAWIPALRRWTNNNNIFYKDTR